MKIGGILKFVDWEVISDEPFSISYETDNLIFRQVFR